MVNNVKLLICDDDISTIDAIKCQLDLEKLKISHVLQAYNGEAAIQIVDDERPELILCDIGMPKVDGIAVLKHIYENKIETEFAFLTCFEDFKYAREAVRYGAKNYLTKPVDFEELGDCLQKMIASAQRRRENAHMTVDQNYLDAKCNNLLRQIHDGFYGTNYERIKNVLARNHITQFEVDTPVRIIFMVSDNTEALKNGWDIELLTYSYSRLAEEILTDYVGFVSTVVQSGDRYTYTATYLHTDKYSEQDCFKRCRDFMSLITSNYHMNPVCVISDEFPFYQAEERATELRSQTRKVILQAGKIYTLKAVKEISDSASTLVNEVHILRLVKQKDKEEFLNVVTTAVSKIVHIEKNNATMMSALHNDILQAFYNCFKDNNIPIFLLMQDEQFRVLDQRATRSTADIVNFAGYLFDLTVTELQRKNDETDMMSQVKRYIKEHYKTDINRNDVAAVAYITPNYLSKRFSAETGMTLREYINQLRIEEAKRLLLSTDANISEVASMVGYDNISYFSTVFRKLCGMSPVEWCSGNRNREDKA